jgi:predicted HTH domain antitoxin
MKTISVRLKDKKALDFIARVLNVKKSEAIRDLLKSGRKMRAIELYKESKVSLGLGAKIAGLTLSEFFDLLKEYKIEINLDVEDAKKALDYAEEKM